MFPQIQTLNHHLNIQKTNLTTEYYHKTNLIKTK